MSRLDPLEDLVLATATHRWVSPRELSRLYVDTDRAYTLLEKYFSERFILQTCHRVEFYVYPCCEISRIKEFLGELYGNDSDVLRNFQIFTGREAVKHLLKVAAGLDSAILGECEVLGQLESAYDYAVKRRHVKDVLRTIVERAVRFGKYVRTCTNIARGVTGFGSLTVLYLRKLYQTLDDLKILLVGAGEMGSTLAKELHDAGARQVVILNRTVDKARELAEKYGYLYDVLTKETLLKYLQEVDVAIFAIATREPILTGKDISNLRRKPLIIDLGMPHNVSDDVDTAIVWLEDLAKIAEKYNREKMEEAKKIENLIQQEIENITLEVRKKILKRLLSEYIKFSYTVAEHELKRAITSRLIDKNLENTIKILLSSTINKITRPIIRLVEEYSKEKAHEIHEILTTLTKLIKEEFNYLNSTNDENGSRRSTNEDGPKR